MMTHPNEIMLFPNPDYENPWCRPIIGDQLDDDDDEFGPGVSYILESVHADEIARLAAELTRLRASESAALERVKVLEAALQFYAGAEVAGIKFAPGDDAGIRARATLTPTADKEPKT